MEESKTGNIRYRIQKFTHKLILQMEIKCINEEFVHGYIERRTGYIWRDATIEDISETKN